MKTAATMATWVQCRPMKLAMPPKTSEVRSRARAAQLFRRNEICLDMHGRNNSPKKTPPRKMSDTEMDGGVALNGASPSHSQLAERINSGAMDVKSPNLNGAASVADSTITSRLYEFYISPHNVD